MGGSVSAGGWAGCVMAAAGALSAAVRRNLGICVMAATITAMVASEPRAMYSPRWLRATGGGGGGATATGAAANVAMGTAGWATVCPEPRTLRRAERNASAVWKRCAGSFSRDMRMISLSAGGRLGSS